MSSFLGVPIVSGRGDIAGAFYLTDKEGAAEFSDADQALIETFAAHAALALENARLHERSRELSIVEERNRLARELHDAVDAEALRRRARGRVGQRAAGARHRRGGARSSRSCASSRARRWRSCAR